MNTETSKTQWGRWHYVKSNNTLEFREVPGRGMIYWIDMESMNSSAQCLDWIFQVSFKTWMTTKDRSDLLKAIHDLVNPQATLCSWGFECGPTARAIEARERREK